jgi:hypothetical protein
VGLPKVCNIVYQEHNQPHSTYAISIMNKTPREEPPQEDRTFAEQEIAAMRRRLRTLVRTKVIVPLAKRQVGPQ